MSFSDAINAPRIQVTSVPTPDVNPNNVDRNEEEVGRKLELEVGNKKQAYLKLIEVANLALKQKSPGVEALLKAADLAADQVIQAQSLQLEHLQTVLKRTMSDLVKSAGSVEAASVIRKAMARESVKEVQSFLSIINNSSAAKQSAQHSTGSQSNASEGTRSPVKSSEDQ